MASSVWWKTAGNLFICSPNENQKETASDGADMLSLLPLSLYLSCQGQQRSED